MSLQDRRAAANAAARKVAEERRTERQRRRDSIRADWDWVKAERAARRAALSKGRGELQRRTMTLPTVPQPPVHPLESPSAPVTDPRPKFVGFAWASLILGVVGVMFSGLPIFDVLPMLCAIVGIVLGGIALFGSRKRLAAASAVLCVLAGVLTVFPTAAENTVGPASSLVPPPASVKPPAALPAPQVPPAAAVPIPTATAPTPATPTEPVKTPTEQATVRRQPVAPQPVAPQPIKPQPVEQDNDSSTVYYKNCNAARTAGAAPIKRGEPGYRPELDRDNNGIACEK